MVPILSQMNPIHTFTPFSPKIHFSIIFPSTPGFSERLLSLTYRMLNFFLSKSYTIFQFGSHSKSFLLCPVLVELSKPVMLLFVTALEQCCKLSVCCLAAVFSDVTYFETLIICMYDYDE